MKSILFIALTLCLLTITTVALMKKKGRSDAKITTQKVKQDDESFKTPGAEAGSSANPYVNDETVLHSIYRERNAWNRLSAEGVGVPQINSDKEKEIPNDDSLFAFRVAKYFQSIFDFLNEDGDEFVKEEDLQRAFEMYEWPVPEGEEKAQRVQQLMQKFDKDQDKQLTLPEFVPLIQDIWGTQSDNSNQKCITALGMAINVFKKVFDYCDSSKDGKISRKELKDGLFQILDKKLDDEDVARNYQVFDRDGDSLLLKEEYILAQVSLDMTRKVEDSSILTNFFEELK